MTIHDIVCICGSLQADSVIFVKLSPDTITWVGEFKDLPKNLEYSGIRIFFTDVDTSFYPRRALFTFYLK